MDNSDNSSCSSKSDSDHSVNSSMSSSPGSPQSKNSQPSETESLKSSVSTSKSNTTTTSNKTSSSFTASSTLSPVSRHEKKGGNESNRNQSKHRNNGPPPGFLGRRLFYSEASLRYASRIAQSWQANRMSDGRVLNTYLVPTVTPVPQPLFLDPFSASNHHQNGYYKAMSIPVYYNPYNCGISRSKPIIPPLHRPPPPSTRNKYKQANNTHHHHLCHHQVQHQHQHQQRQRSVRSTVSRERRAVNVPCNTFFSRERKINRVSDMRPNALTFVPNKVASEVDVKKSADEISRSPLLHSLPTKVPPNSPEQPEPKPLAQSQPEPELVPETESPKTKEDTSTAVKEPPVPIKQEYTLNLTYEEGKAIWEKPLKVFKSSPSELPDDTGGDDFNNLLLFACGPHFPLMYGFYGYKEIEYKKEVEVARPEPAPEINRDDDSLRTNKQEDSIEVNVENNTHEEKEETDEKVEEEKKSPIQILRRPVVSPSSTEMVTTTGNYEFTEMARYRGMAYVHQKKPSTERSSTGRDDQQSARGNKNTKRIYTSNGGSWQPDPQNNQTI